MSIPHLFRLAREASLMSDYSGNARVGCIVVYKGCILAKGWNTDKTHPKQAQFNVHRFRSGGNKYLPDKAHAEISALTKIRFLDIDFSRVHIYVYRELRDGTIAMARPCEACFHALQEYGIKHVHYSTDRGFAYECLK